MVNPVSVNRGRLSFSPRVDDSRTVAVVPVGVKELVGVNAAKSVGVKMGTRLFVNPSSLRYNA